MGFPRDSKSRDLGFLGIPRILFNFCISQTEEPSGLYTYLILITRPEPIRVREVLGLGDGPAVGLPMKSLGKYGS